MAGITMSWAQAAKPVLGRNMGRMGGKLGRPQAWDGFKIGFEYGFLIWFNHVEWIENG